MIGHRRSPYNFVDGECIDATHDDRHCLALAVAAVGELVQSTTGQMDGKATPERTPEIRRSISRSSSSVQISGPTTIAAESSPPPWTTSASCTKAAWPKETYASPFRLAPKDSGLCLPGSVVSPSSSGRSPRGIGVPATASRRPRQPMCLCGPRSLAAQRFS
jgi:hypothetical protein